MKLASTQKLTRLTAIASLSAMWIGCAWDPSRTAVEDVLSARDFTIRGNSDLRDGKWQEAEQHFAQAVEANPEGARARRLYAETLWMRGLHQNAIEQMQEAAQRAPQDPTLLIRAGEMHLNQENLKLATNYANQALKLNAKLPAAWALKGNILANQGQLDSALSSYFRALTYHEDSPKIKLAIARIHRSQLQPERALAILDSMDNQYSDETLFLRGLVLKDLRQYDEAARVFSIVTQNRPGRPEPYFEMANIHFQQGNTVNARLAAEGALRVAPNHDPSRELIYRLDQGALR